jgi:hypothetical protein
MRTQADWADGVDSNAADSVGFVVREDRMNVGRVVRSVRMWFVVAMCALFALMPLGQASAYQGEQQMWSMTNYSDQTVIIAGRFDTGDVNMNTAIANQVDAQFVRESLGSDYRRVKFVGNEEPVAGTTVVRRFTFTTNKGYAGTLIVTDEWGPNIWMFIFVNENLRATEMWNFVSATVQNRYPSEIPAGYGVPDEMDV